MNPLMVITDLLVDIPPKIAVREIVRGLCFRDGLILLMFSQRDQMYGTPGGGIILNESKLDTLHRELLEEVGAKQIKVIEHLGFTEEIRESRSAYGKVVKLITDYYRVDVLQFISSALEEHEEEMGLIPMWVSIDEAIRQNTTVLQSFGEHKITFYDTQTEMLKYIKSRFGL
jgi:ADP-ribose pyrophosphatase YjhB (NUDIX family)